MSKLDDFVAQVDSDNIFQSKEDYYPICDAQIEFETIPVVAAVKEIEDARLEYNKETDCIRELVNTGNQEGPFPWDKPTYSDKWITKKEIAVLGWKIGISCYLENAWGYHPNDSREKYYRLGCLNKSGKLIIDFNYCIIEVVGKYIFAGYNGEYRYNTYQGLYDLYTINGDFLFGGFTQYHLYEEENILACNWGGNWYDSSQEGSPLYRFNSYSGYWSLYDLSPIKNPLKTENEWELPNWQKTGVIKSLLPLRDGRDYGIPIKTQISSFDTMICGIVRKMPNLPIETLFIMGNHTNNNYPCISGGTLYDVHLFINEAESWGLGGNKRLFTDECFDYNLSKKELIKNNEYRAEDLRRESNSNVCHRPADDEFISPFDNPNYNDALDMDQQSPDFWDTL